MELAFTKLFNKIVTSSVWSEDDKTRIMWITMLALSDRNGYVAAALPGLADVSRMSIQEADAAIKKLESPDQYSRTKVLDGRRIVPVDGGWEIVTYDIHRHLLSKEERRQYKADWIRKRRQKSRQKTTVDDRMSNSPSASASVRTKGESERDWLEGLKSDPAYKGIDVQREFDKMVRWCKENKQTATRRRFVNWLNRADRRLEGKPTKADYKRNYLPPAREPTEEELAKAREIATREASRLREQFRPPSPAEG